jgi:hypothetical protein
MIMQVSLSERGENSSSEKFVERTYLLSEPKQPCIFRRVDEYFSPKVDGLRSVRPRENLAR